MTGAWVRVRAYSSSANLGPGFDALAVALDAFYDEVEARLEPGARGVWLDGVSGPHASDVDLEANTAVEAARILLALLGRAEEGVSLRIWKGVPVSRGLGSSGASAAAAVVAVSRLLGTSPGAGVLLEAAGRGESVSAGTSHYDNVAASLLGGLAVVVAMPHGVKALSLPLDAWFVVVVPQVPARRGKTGVMRGVLPRQVELGRAVGNWQKLAMLVAALVKGDYRLAGEMMMGDNIVEPVRAPFVPCYDKVREAAVEAGALGVAISGAGPSMLALVEGPEAAEPVARALEEAYSSCGLEAAAKATRVAGPAEVVGAHI